MFPFQRGDNWYGFNGNEVGLVPDPVDWLSNFDLAANQNNTLLLEVRIPAQCPAGNYFGEISFQATGLSFNLPIEVEVWPIRLTEKPQLATVFCGPDIQTESGIHQLYKGVVTHEKYGSSGLKFNLSQDKKEISYDGKKYFSGLQKLHNDYAVNSFALPPSLLGGSSKLNQNYLSSGIPVDEEGFSQLHRTFLKTMRQQYINAGLLNNVFYYVMDEFPASSAGAFARIAADAKRSSEMPVMALTHEWFPELAASKDIDIWCVPWHFFSTKDDDWSHWRELRRQGLELWSYMNSLYCINVSWNPKAMRLFPMVLARYDYSGSLWWHVAAFYGKNVRKEPWGLMNKEKQKFMYGSGYVFYAPEEDSGNWGSSLRWENYVQGTEDYKLLQVLKEKWKAAEASLDNKDAAFSAETALAMYVSQLASSFRAQTYFVDPLYINRFRQLLAKEIIALPQAPLVLVNFEPADTRDANSLHLRGLLEEGSEVTVNGNKVDMWGTGKVFTYEAELESGLNCFEIVVSKDGKSKKV